MKSHVAWMTAEEKILIDHYETSMTRQQLCQMIPRHSWYAIRCHAARDLKLIRPTKREPRHAPAWERIAELLKVESLTINQIMVRLQMKNQRVFELITLHRSDVHIAGWQPPKGAGRWSPSWAYGNASDAPTPFMRSTAEAKARRRINPFAAALGLVEAPKGEPGRVYIHLTDSKDDEYAEAA